MRLVRVLTSDYRASLDFSHVCLSLLIIILGQNNIDKILSNIPLTCTQAGKIPGSFLFINIDYKAKCIVVYKSVWAGDIYLILNLR